MADYTSTEKPDKHLGQLREINRLLTVIMWLLFFGVGLAIGVIAKLN